MRTPAERRQAGPQGRPWAGATYSGAGHSEESPNQPTEALEREVELDARRHQGFRKAGCLGGGAGGRTLVLRATRARSPDPGLQGLLVDRFGPGTSGPAGCRTFRFGVFQPVFTERRELDRRSSASAALAVICLICTNICL
jgi:hypothetical protein